MMIIIIISAFIDKCYSRQSEPNKLPCRTALYSRTYIQALSTTKHFSSTQKGAYQLTQCTVTTM